MTCFLVHTQKFTSSLKKMHLTEFLTTSTTTTNAPESVKVLAEDRKVRSSWFSFPQCFCSLLFSIPRACFFLA